MRCLFCKDERSTDLRDRRDNLTSWSRAPSARGGQAARCFELLPHPSAGGVVFDIEGDPFWEPARGLHLLFGLLLREGAGWEYRALWAHDRA